MEMDTMTLEAKRKKALALLKQKKAKKAQDHGVDYKTYTYDMFMNSMGQAPAEIKRFSQWVNQASADGIYAFESARTSMQTTEVDLVRETGEAMHLLNFSSYNYLGFGYHPEVIKAAQDAVAQFGLGANSSPVISGTYMIHRQLENALVKFFGMPDTGVSLFSSGYAVNLGVIQAYIKPGNYVVCDRAAHMSILEGAKISGGKVEYFEHNDLDSLRVVLEKINDGFSRILVCIEGVYSGEGDYGKVKEIVKLAKKHQAAVLIDEAHSVLVAGEHGRGVAEEQGVLEDIDFYVMTFSKAMSGVGGAVLAKKDMIRYINWYAKCRMFSCALDPAVTGGMVKVLELVSSDEGYKRRARLHKNADYLRACLEPYVDIGASTSWIVTAIFHDEKQTLALNDYLQREGLDTSIMQFPAVPKNEARIRMFVTSEHTREQIEEAARIIRRAAETFHFLKEGAPSE